MNSTLQRRLLLELRDRDGDCCHICGFPADFKKGTQSKQRASLDHILPKSKGGMLILDNLLIAHIWCNERRGNNRVTWRLRWRCIQHWCDTMGWKPDDSIIQPLLYKPTKALQLSESLRPRSSLP